MQPNITFMWNANRLRTLRKITSYRDHKIFFKKLKYRVTV